MPPGPMALRCHDFNGIPLLSHAGSTTYFPSRVMRQFGSLQTVPEDTARTRFEHTWREDQTSVDCQSDIQQLVHEDSTDSPQLEDSTPYGAPSTSSIAVQAELTSLRSERDRLRWEVAEKDEQLIDQRQLQRELAQALAELQRRDQELARANATLERSKKRTHGGPHKS
ncbi:hypothetical protein CDL15_Pgr020933 [Punica granatum]|uniref:Uncharacterized protein n=1 Tax=Punica granatum TaxID=22663 RepID=A0A218VX23_PUNGR|nr:hypothetical protein CDL15_Pgr020933 [Punica granatum]